MTEDTGNDPSRLNTRPKRSVSNNLKVSGDISTPSASKPSTPVVAEPRSPWTEQEELALLESLKNHKWGEWDAIQKDVKTRSFDSISSKCFKISSGVFDPKNKSNIAYELRDLALKKRREFSKLKNYSSADDTSMDNPGIKNLKANADKTTEVAGLAKPGSLWTEEEELVLFESLKNREWREWDAIQKDVKTRSVHSIIKKCERLCTESLPVRNKSNIADELRILALKKRDEHLKMERSSSQKGAINQNLAIEKIEAKEDKISRNEIAALESESIIETIADMPTEENDIIDIPNTKSMAENDFINSEPATSTESSDYKVIIGNEIIPESANELSIKKNETDSKAEFSAKELPFDGVTAVIKTLPTNDDSIESVSSTNLESRTESKSNSITSLLNFEEQNILEEPTKEEVVLHENQEDILTEPTNEVLPVDEIIPDADHVPVKDGITLIPVDDEYGVENVPVLFPIKAEDVPIKEDFVAAKKIRKAKTPPMPTRKATRLNAKSLTMNEDEMTPLFTDSEVVPSSNEISSIPIDTENKAKIVPVPNEERLPIIDEIVSIPADAEVSAKDEIEEPAATTTTTKVRKAKAQPKSAKKTITESAKSPPKTKPATTPSKRTYTRKIAPKPPITRPSMGEEVSILSSSSDSFTKESINIMSSSSSSEGRNSLASISSISSAGSLNESIPSVQSSKKSRRKSSSETSSVKSTKSSIKSAKSSTSNMSAAKSVNSVKSTSSKSSSVKSTTSSKKSDGVVAEWEKKACPAIFTKSSLKDPELNYKNLKTRLQHALKKNPSISNEEVKVKLIKQFSDKSVEQVLKILRDPQIATEDFEFLKKMSTTSSGRKRKIRSEEGDWIDPNEVEGRVISHEPATPLKEKRKRKAVKKDLFTEDGVLSSAEDPFTLILLNDYTEHLAGHVHNHDSLEYDDFQVKAPFKVEMCESVIMLMDLHSHLHSSEIIGLLGGRFTLAETESSVLRIEFGFPCATAHSTGTQVDVDPLSEMEAGDYFERNGVRTAGWYHSHPNFEPNPSLRDLETQTIYQGLFRNSQPGSDVAPFVGVIVNPYLAVTESSSHVECFYVAPAVALSQDRLPYRLPIARLPFSPADFPQILDKMREILERASTASDRLDMQKNAEPGAKRIDKLLKSLQFHGNLTEEQLEQVKELLN